MAEIVFRIDGQRCEYELRGVVIVADLMMVAHTALCEVRSMLGGEADAHVDDAHFWSVFRACLEAEASLATILLPVGDGRHDGAPVVGRA